MCRQGQQDMHRTPVLVIKTVNVLYFMMGRLFIRDGVLEDWPQPRGHHEDKILWPWPRRPQALDSTMRGLGFGFEEIWP